LIESDLRRPSIGQTLRVRAPRGVAEVLLGKVDLVEALVWIRPYGPQLELLLATTADAREIDRISSDSARSVVREARAMADFVVIDSPPMTDVTDALAFAEEADDVLLVARLGNSLVRKMSDLGELLTRHGVVPAGVVLVGAHDTSSYYYYRSSGPQPFLGGLLRRRSNYEDDHTFQLVPATAGNGTSHPGAAAALVGNGLARATAGLGNGAQRAGNGAQNVGNGGGSAHSASHTTENGGAAKRTTPTARGRMAKDEPGASKRGTGSAKDKTNRSRNGAAE
jgi:hypothetical protein